MGSGSSRKQDYVSVDLHTDADIGLDLTRPLPWKDGEVDNIYSSHFIEHLSRKEWELASKEWQRVLKVGGTIEIRCPDIIKVCEKFLLEPTDPYRMMQLYGQQGHEGEFHKNGFTHVSLTESFPECVPTLLVPSSDTELHMSFRKVRRV